MIKVQGKLPRRVTLACSGGVDSMAVLNFLMNNHEVRVEFVHHGTEASNNAMKLLLKYYRETGAKFTLSTTRIDSNVPTRISREEHWRNERYKVFHSTDAPVVMCHHLDDCVETWIWSSLNGEGKVIPYRNRNVIRPFRLNRKQVFIDWCIRHNVPWSEDNSNQDTDYMRNYIRHELMPHALHVNQGLHKVIQKKVSSEDIDNQMETL